MKKIYVKARFKDQNASSSLVRAFFCDANLEKSSISIKSGNVLMNLIVKDYSPDEIINAITYFCEIDEFDYGDEKDDSEDKSESDEHSVDDSDDMGCELESEDDNSDETSEENPDTTSYSDEESEEEAEIGNMVLRAVKKEGFIEDEGKYFDLIKKGIREQNIKLESILLGKSKDGLRTITLADIWPEKIQTRFR